MSRKLHTIALLAGALGVGWLGGSSNWHVTLPMTGDDVKPPEPFKDWDEFYAHKKRTKEEARQARKRAREGRK